jgi:phenylpropionate dioxygenase-like ring-hydroxylating dioxygenase large terminal subunit
MARTDLREEPQMETTAREADMNTYLRNCWYQAAWASEVSEGVLARTILDTPLAIFRKEDGLAALVDRCPHRFAPLSRGRLCEGVIECGYHGLAFDAAGKCVRNPHGPITNAMQVAAIPVIERHDAIWVWMGDPALADPAKIPDLSYIDETPITARIQFHMPTAANYQLLADNIMDLSHADYLHPASLGGVFAEASARVYRRGDGLVAEWKNNGCQAPGLFQQKIPTPAKADLWIEVEWHAPAVMTLSTAVVPEGVKRELQDEIYALHNMTPETSTTTHYFMCATRRDQMESVEFTEMLRPMLAYAFMDEDKPMIEAQQARMGKDEFWSLGPVLLKIDSAGVQVRRELEALIAQETALHVTP